MSKPMSKESSPAKTKSNTSSDSMESGPKNTKPEDKIVGKTVEKTQKQRSQLKCYICQNIEGNGPLIKFCKCRYQKEAHYECLQRMIVMNQSLICRSCQTPYIGITPVYAKKRISRFFLKYVRIFAYRVIGIPLFILLLFRVVLIKNEWINSKERYFWSLFFVYLFIGLIIVGIYTYKGVKAIKDYNRRSNDIIEVELNEQPDKVVNK